METPQTKSSRFLVIGCNRMEDTRRQRVSLTSLLHPSFSFQATTRRNFCPTLLSSHSRHQRDYTVFYPSLSFVPYIPHPPFPPFQTRTVHHSRQPAAGVTNFARTLSGVAWLLINGKTCCTRVSPHRIAIFHRLQR